MAGRDGRNEKEREEFKEFMAARRGDALPESLTDEELVDWVLYDPKTKTEEQLLNEVHRLTREVQKQTGIANNMKRKVAAYKRTVRGYREQLEKLKEAKPRQKYKNKGKHQGRGRR